MAQIRKADYAAAAVVAVLVVAVNPLVVLLVTGRSDLSLRATFVSITLEVFLVVILCALLTRGWARNLFFHLLVWTFPLVLLAGLEGAAGLLRLSDRIGMMGDTSLLPYRNRWQASESQWVMMPEGFRLHRPWVSDGIVINEHGLRTAPPNPKAAGEWRVAITGGSVVWGWLILDADTIPVRLQEALHQQGHTNVSVYNFGIEGGTIAQELALLQRFRDIYAIDQVLFYTGANDIFYSYLQTLPPRRIGQFWEALSRFELIQTLERLPAPWQHSAERLAQLDAQVLPQILRSSSLKIGLMAAIDYCRMAMLHCDVVLQPLLFGRQSLFGSEIAIAQTSKRVYPRLDMVSSSLYRDALVSVPADQIRDFSKIFDQTMQQVFVDMAHVTEAGNYLIAKQLVPIVAPKAR
jgi:hypothetical protein